MDVRVIGRRVAWARCSRIVRRRDVAEPQPCVWSGVADRAVGKSSPCVRFARVAAVCDPLQEIALPISELITSPHHLTMVRGQAS